MPTVIDSLVVELGLDGKKFDDGQRDALRSFTDTKNQATQLGNSIEEQGKRMADVFGIVKKGAVGILGAFAGEETVAFIDKIARMDAQTFQLAHTVGISTERLSLWQGMVRQVGGSAADASQTIGTLQDAMTNFAMGAGLLPAPLAALFSRAGVQRGETSDQALHQIGDYIDRERKSGRMSPQVARWWLEQIPGMNSGMLNVLMQGTKGMNDLADAARRAGLETEMSGEAALDYQKKASVLDLAIQHLARVTYPSLTGALQTTANLLEGPAGGWISSILAGAGFGALAGSFLPGVGTGLGAIAGGAAGAFTYATSGGGATRGDRNNNPGNIKFGQFAQSQGATGQDSGGFAVFPSQTAGETAMANLLHSSYRGLTLSQIVQKWTNGADPSYLQSVMASTGLGANDVPNMNNNAVVAKLIAGMMRGEGTHRGGAAAAAGIHHTMNRSGDKTSSVTVGQINVSSSKAAARDVAMEIPAAMKRIKTATPADYGLT